MNKVNNKIRVFLFFGTLFFIGLLVSSNAFARQMSTFPKVKLQSLDKVTAHSATFEANVGSTLKFGPLFIKVQTCQKSSPLDDPESAAFVQIWENDEEEEPQWVFSGWMFASSPALSSLDHAIYDVWVVDCLDEKGSTGMVDDFEDPSEEQNTVQEETPIEN